MVCETLIPQFGTLTLGVDLAPHAEAVLGVRVLPLGLVERAGELLDFVCWHCTFPINYKQIREGREEK
jgi:hypothetical protein